MIAGSARGAGAADEDVQIGNLDTRAAAPSRKLEHLPEATVSVEALVGQQKLPQGENGKEIVKERSTCGPMDAEAALPEASIQLADALASMTAEVAGPDRVQRDEGVSSLLHWPGLAAT